MKRSPGIFAITAALTACVLMFGCAGQTGSADNAITVSASATAQVAPDKAAIGATLEGQADTADAARTAGKEAANALSAQLKSLGVAESEIKVGEVSAEARYEDGGTTVQDIATGYYDWYGNWISTGSQQVTQNVGNVLVGYDYSVHVAASNVSASQLGQVIRAAVEAGATGFDGLTFTVTNREAAYQQALAAAVEAAHVKAESLAKAGGVYVGRMVNLAEGEPPAFEATVSGNAAAIQVGDEATYDAVSGTVPVEAAVTVSYAIS